MFVYLTKTQSVFLKNTLDNNCGKYKVALCEFSYKVKWFNISETKKNNWIQKFDSHSNAINSLTIPDGYYGICSLKEILEDYGITLKPNSANLKVTLTFKIEDDQRMFNFAGGFASL